jgi:hypothetical protein
MKRQSTSGRLLLPCTVALVLLVFARPGNAQDAAAGKTAEVRKDGIVATASSGLDANLGTSELPGPQFLGSCPFIKCWITCGNGLGYNLSFTSVYGCYSYFDASGCHTSGIFTCSADGPGVAGC